MLCLKQSDRPEENLEIKGRFENDVFGYIKMKFYRCIGPECKSEQQIDQQLTDGYFALNFANNAIKLSSL